MFQPFLLVSPFVFDLEVAIKIEQAVEQNDASRNGEQNV